MIDLEERLRATYRAVAERTQVASQLAPLDTDLAPLVPLGALHSRPRRPSARLLTFAAALVLLVVAATAVLNRRDTPATNSPSSTMDGRTRAIPGMVLPGFGLVESGTNSQMGLPGFPDQPDGYSGSVLRYDGANGKTYLVTAASDPGVLPLASPERMTLASGAVAAVLRETDFQRITLAWVQTGTIVSIRADGFQLDDIVSIADSMWFTDPQTFDRAIERAGFASTGESWRPDGAPFEVDLRGSAQEGLQIVTKDDTVALVGRPMCIALPLFGTGGETRWLLLVGPRATDFRVETPSGSTRLVSGDAVPGMPSASIAIMALDGDRSADQGFDTPFTCTAEDQG